MAMTVIEAAAEVRKLAEALEQREALVAEGREAADKLGELEVAHDLGEQADSKQMKALHEAVAQGEVAARQVGPLTGRLGRAGEVWRKAQYAALLARAEHAEAEMTQLDGNLGALVAQGQALSEQRAQQRAEIEQIAAEAGRIKVLPVADVIAAASDQGV